jgi:hypothetical protein
VVTNIRYRTDGRLPWRVGAITRVVWPAVLLLMFLAVFRGAGISDRVRDNAVGRAEDGATPGPAVHISTKSGAAGPAAQCEQPTGLDVAALEQCLLGQPDDVELMLDLGAAYEAAGRWTDAEGVYVRATRIDPRDGVVHRRLGRGYLAHGDRQAARREGMAAQATLPGDPEVLHLVEADADRTEP